MDRAKLAEIAAERFRAESQAAEGLAAARGLILFRVPGRRDEWALLRIEGTTGGPASCYSGAWVFGPASWEACRREVLSENRGSY